VFIKILQEIIKQRLEGKEAQTANILFGFEGYAGVPIQDRYRAVAKLYNPYWSWENYRKEPLTRHLLAVYLALKREADLERGIILHQEHPRKGRSGLVGQDWVAAIVRNVLNGRGDRDDSVRRRGAESTDFIALRAAGRILRARLLQRVCRDPERTLSVDGAGDGARALL
jgi:hypothetical protein